MTKEQAIKECMELVSSVRRADGVYELNADMLKTVIEVAILDGGIIETARLPARVDKIIERAAKL